MATAAVAQFSRRMLFVMQGASRSDYQTPTLCLSVSVSAVNREKSPSYAVISANDADLLALFPNPHTPQLLRS